MTSLKVINMISVQYVHNSVAMIAVITNSYKYINYFN